MRVGTAGEVATQLASDLRPWVEGQQVDEPAQLLKEEGASNKPNTRRELCGVCFLPEITQIMHPTGQKPRGQ